MKTFILAIAFTLTGCSTPTPCKDYVPLECKRFIPSKFKTYEDYLKTKE